MQSQSVRKCHLSIKAKESLMELSCDTSLKTTFEALSLPEFWIYIKKRTLGTLKTSHRGDTTFWNDISVKKTFSAMTAIKSQYRNRLQLESDLLVAVSTIQPKMSHLVSNMQSHPSH
jgi:hypothetical protein